MFPEITSVKNIIFPFLCLNLKSGQLIVPVFMNSAQNGGVTVECGNDALPLNFVTHLYCWFIPRFNCS